MANTLKQFRKRAEALKKRIAASRDDLRDLISDMEAIEENCDGAVSSLQHAIDTFEGAADTLSEYV